MTSHSAEPSQAAAARKTAAGAVALRSGVPASLLPVRVLIAICGAFLALKFAHLVLAGPFMDETYYWLWGQHPDLSYFDHPPFNAWMQGVAGAVLGWNLLGLRVMVGLTLIGDLVVLYWFAKALAPAQWQENFWLSATLFLATPIFFSVSGLALPDHWLMFFTLLALYGFYRFLAGWQAGAGQYRWLYLGAVALGLAMLSKYNGALLGAGLFALVVLDRRYRPLLADLHIYLAVALVAAMQAPVVIWNVTESFSSYQFILSDRHDGMVRGVAWEGVAGFVLGALAFLSPFLILAIGRLVFERTEMPGRALGRMVFLAASLAILMVSLSTDVLFHWNLVAYVGVLPFVGSYLRQRWVLIGHLIYGAGFCAVVLFNYTVFPVSGFATYTDQTSAWSYGWDEVSQAVREAQGERDTQFIAASDYALAAPLAFALHDGQVTSLAQRQDQFDYWFDRPAHAGQNAILVTDRYRRMTRHIKGQFKSVKRLKKINIERFGVVVNRLEIHLGTGFKP